MNLTSRFEPEWVLHADAVDGLLCDLGFRAEVVDHIVRTSRAISQSEELPQFLNFSRHWIENPSRLPNGGVPMSWQLLTAVSVFPQVLASHQARAIPFAITATTLLDLQRWMEEYFERTGNWGFEKLSWFRLQIGGEFFQIGRLQYHLGRFELERFQAPVVDRSGKGRRHQFRS